MNHTDDPRRPAASSGPEPSVDAFAQAPTQPAGGTSVQQVDRFPAAPALPGFTIRPATIADLPGAALLRARSWQESFADFLPEDSLAGFGESVWTARLVEEWTQLLASDEVVWLAFRGDDLVGLAQAEPDADPHAPTRRKMSKLYLLDATKGTGLADALLERAIGDQPAHLWVLEPNVRARRFYERHGFVVDGAAQHLDDDLSHIREIRMVRAPRAVRVDH